MFRCTEELKGLAIDYDSFKDIPLDKWGKINSIIDCVFITDNLENKKILEENLEEIKILYLDVFQKIFSPSVKTHGKVLEILSLETTEIAYVSSNYSFIKNASSFLSATIWLSNTVDYDETKKLPDMVVEDINRLIDALEKNVAGFYGEVVMFPGLHGLGSILNVDFYVDDKAIPMSVIGRYFGYSHYMNQLHPYSSAIYLNKKDGKSYNGVFNEKFGKIYAKVISLIDEDNNIDGVCAVPVKPRKIDRFKKILDIISDKCNIENLSLNFSCIKSYSDQKGLAAEEREKNIKGVFKYSGDLTGKTVVLIDDIVTTGATLRECVRVLRNAGAEEVLVVVMAINQLGSSYWNTDLPKVSCPVCGNKMTLFVSGKGDKKGKFFFSCMDCYYNKRSNTSLDFPVGWETFLEEENRKFAEVRNENIIDKWLDDEWLDDSFDLKRNVACPYCGKNNKVDLSDECNVSSSERPMGADTVYEFDAIENCCSYCGKQFSISGYIREYPTGALDSENIDINKLDEE
jgi:hypothetical protein